MAFVIVAGLAFRFARDDFFAAIGNAVLGVSTSFLARFGELSEFASTVKHSLACVHMLFLDELAALRRNNPVFNSGQKTDFVNR